MSTTPTPTHPSSVPTPQAPDQLVELHAYNVYIIQGGAFVLLVFLAPVCSRPPPLPPTVLRLTAYPRPPNFVLRPLLSFVPFCDRFGQTSPGF